MRIIVLCLCILGFTQQMLPDVKWEKAISSVKQGELYGLNMATEIAKACTQVLSLAAMWQWFEFEF